LFYVSTANVAAKWKSEHNSKTTENEEKKSQALSQATFLIVINWHMIVFDHLISPMREDYDIVLSAKVFAQRGIILPQITQHREKLYYRR